jgi:hypothetical protein
VDGVRRSTRIAAARSIAVADLDSTANNKEPAEQTRKLMLLAQACATETWRRATRTLKESKVKNLGLGDSQRDHEARPRGML